MDHGSSLASSPVTRLLLGHSLIFLRRKVWRCSPPGSFAATKAFWFLDRKLSGKSAKLVSPFSIAFSEFPAKAD
jgi:hypothetical protein